MKAPSICVLAAVTTLLAVSCGDDSAPADAGGDSGVVTDTGSPATDSSLDTGPATDAGTPPSVPDEGPALLFTDLSSAPEGAFVTIWGRELGAGAVRVGGTEAEVLSRAVDSGNGLDRVEVVIPAVGEGIRVEGVDGELAFTARNEGRVFFVHHDDGDDESTTGSLDAPFRTLGQARRTLMPGDVAYVRESATPYDELDAMGADADYESMILVREGSSGTAALPIAIVGYPGEVPLLDAGAANARRGAHITGASHWTIAKLSFVDGRSTAVSVQGGGPHENIRIIANTATNFMPPNTGVFSVNAARSLRVLGNHIYDAGVPDENNSHMLYYGGFSPDGEDVEFAYNHIHGERGGRLIQIFGHRDDDNLRNLRIHHNILYDGPYDGVLVSRSDGSNAAWIEDAHIHHNVISETGRAGINLLNPGCAFDVHDNVVHSSARTIWVNDIRTADVYDNCLDAEVQNDAAGDVRDNRTDYPACAM